MSNVLNVMNGVIIEALVRDCKIAPQLLLGQTPRMKGTIKDFSRIMAIEAKVVLEEGRPE